MVINKRRLRALVRMIDELPEYTKWDMHSGRYCALGHAANDPWFIAKGFIWDNWDGHVRFGEAWGRSAVITFFGIAPAVYNNLFILPWNATREEMSARITKYVDGLVDHRRAKA